jgi:hypothetical protein
MARTTCPSCKRKLWISDSVNASVLTCPACLAKIENPRTETGISSGPLVHREIVAKPTRERCPTCGKRMESLWRFCPSCGGRHGARGSLLDDEARRDRKGTNIILWVLIAFGGLGLVSYLFVGVKKLAGGVWWFLPAGILVVLFMFLLATAIMFYRTREDPSRRGLERVVLGTLALTGGLVVLLCVLVGAFVLFLFVLCFEPPGERGGRGHMIGQIDSRVPLMLICDHSYLGTTCRVCPVCGPAPIA